MNVNISQTMTFARSTKNTHRYEAEDAAAAVSVLYVAKSAMSTPPPIISIAIVSE